MDKKRMCPKCNKELVKVSVPGRKMIFECSEHGKFRVVVRRQKDYSNPANWKSECEECGGIMDYYNFKYCCRKCGHILEV